MYWASHRMLSTYFTIYITSPLSFCRIRFIQYSGSIKKFKYPLSYPSELFASIRLHTKQPVLQNTEHQSQIHPHQHRSLYILSPKMKTMETGQYQPQSRTQDNPHYSQCISHTSIHLELSGSVLGWQQLIVSVMSLAGTGSTQLQLNRSLSQPEHNHRIHTAAAASLTVTAWTQSQSCITADQQATYRAEGSGDVISDYRWLTICFTQLRVQRFMKHWWFDEGSYWYKAWFKYRDRIRKARFLQAVKNFLIS